RVQPQQGGGNSPAPPVGCCQPPDPPIPDTINATVLHGGGCPCLWDMVIPLTANGDGTWDGSVQTSGCVSSPENFTIHFDCSGAACRFATLRVQWDNHIDP